MGWGDTGRVEAENGIRFFFFFFRFWHGPGCSRVRAERAGDQFTPVHVRRLPREAFTPGTFVLAQREEGQKRAQERVRARTHRKEGYI